MNPEAYIEMAQTEDEHWWFVARRMILMDCIRLLSLPPQANILEIGCGTGGNLSMLSQFGKVYGIEMEDEALALAMHKSNHRHTLIKGKCPDNLHFEHIKFDLICMLDVLEHIDQDISALIALKQYLSSNGKILLTVPAHPWLFGAHDQYLHHQRRYTQSQLQRVLGQAGLVSARMSYFNCILFPLAALTRLIEKYLNLKNSTGGTTPVAPLNWLLKKIFMCERYLLRYVNLPFGVSLLCIAKA